MQISQTNRQTNRQTDRHLALYAFVWLCMNMYGYVWLCMPMYDYVCLGMTMYDYVWLCLTMYDYVGDNLWLKITFRSKQPLMEDNLPLMEDNLLGKTTFVGRQQKNFQPKILFRPNFFLDQNVFEI